MDLTGASILIAGASGGIGSRCASILTRRRADLTLVARSLPDRASRPRCLEISADLRLPSECNRIVARAVEHYGRLDGVINAAGVVAFGNLSDTDTDTIEDVFMTNVFLPMFLFRAAIPHLEPGGFLMSLSGVVADQPMAGMATYSASKAATSGFMSAIRKELRRSKISVIDARPGHTETGLSARPLAGVAPTFSHGLNPDDVAARLISAIEAGETDLGPSAF